MKPSNESLDALRELLGTLDAHELEQVRCAILRQPTLPQKEYSKISKLLEALLQNPDISLAKLGKSVYGHQNDNALKFLRLRLMSKIQDAISGAVVPEAIGQSELGHRLSARICLARRLWKRGAFAAMQVVLNAAINTADTLECYDQLLEGLGLALQYARLCHAPCTDLLLQVAKAERAAQDLREAQRGAQHAWPDAIQPSANIPCASVEHLATSPSQKARFYAQVVRLQQLESNAPGCTVLETAQQLSALLSQQALSHPEFQQIACCHHAHAALQAGLPQRALDALAQCTPLANPDLPLLWQTNLLEAEAHRLLGRPDAALDTCFPAAQHAALDPSPIRKGIRTVIAACASLQAERFQDALQWLCQTDKAVLADPHWNAAHRLLQLQALIELKQFETAELRLEALRKFLRQLQCRPAVAERFTRIVKLLQVLVRHNFDFPAARASLLPGVEQLAGPGQPCGYPFPERYCFHDWLRQKMMPETQQAKRSSPPLPRR